MAIDIGYSSLMDLLTPAGFAHRAWWCVCVCACHVGRNVLCEVVEDCKVRNILRLLLGAIDKMKEESFMVVGMLCSSFSFMPPRYDWCIYCVNIYIYIYKYNFIM